MKFATVLAVPFVALALLGAPAAAEAPADAFMTNLTALCGKSFEGRVATTDPADADFAGKRLVMKVQDCTDDQVRIPFAVGEDRSRTWVVTRTEDGVRLKHDHRHEDGTEDAVSQYGGDSATPGTAMRQEFPVDQFSKDLFVREGLNVSVTNVWAMEVHPGHMFAYELRRANRHFRVEFDLSRPIG